MGVVNLYGTTTTSHQQWVKLGLNWCQSSAAAVLYGLKNWILSLWWNPFWLFRLVWLFWLFWLFWIFSSCFLDFHPLCGKQPSFIFFSFLFSSFSFSILRLGFALRLFFTFPFASFFPSSFHLLSLPLWAELFLLLFFFCFPPFSHLNPVCSSTFSSLLFLYFFLFIYLFVFFFVPSHLNALSGRPYFAAYTTRKGKVKAKEDRQEENRVWLTVFQDSSTGGVWCQPAVLPCVATRCCLQ